MPKIKLRVSLKSSTESSINEYEGILKDDEIIYKDGLNTIKLDFNDHLILTKQNKGYKITINFQKDNAYCIYEDIKSNMGLKMNVTNESFEIEEGFVKLNYTLEEKNKVSYELKYEVIE